MFQRSSRVSLWAAYALTAMLVAAIGCSPAQPGKDKKDGDKKSEAAAKAAGSEDDNVPAPPQKSAPPEPQRIMLPAPGDSPEPPKSETPPARVSAPYNPHIDDEKPEAPKGPAKPEAPKPEAAKPEAPKAEAPKPEAPKVEAPKPVTPKAETPKIEAPKPTPKAEPPKADQSKAGPKPLKKAELLVELPDYCNTPDGMALQADGSVIVSVPNFNDKKAAPLLVKITKDNKVEDFYKLPPHPDTGRMGPMGIRAAPSGDLYLADNQLFHAKDGEPPLLGKSRLVRIVMKDGKPDRMVVVASGLNVANGIAIRDGFVYVTETILVGNSKPLISGVYRFKLDDENVQMKQPLKDDPHVIMTMETNSPVGFGADGICFDKQGRLYVSDFSDGVIYRVILDKDGKVASKTLFAKADFMKSCDGMDYDARTDKIYSADLMGNGVRVIDMDGKVETLAQDGDSDGSGGRLDGPCEALVRGNTIVVASMDFPVKGSVNTKFDKPYTISVIKLD